MNQDFVSVESNTVRGKFYRVYLDQNGKLQCNCPAGVYERPCKHKSSSKVLLWLKQRKTQQ